MPRNRGNPTAGRSVACALSLIAGMAVILATPSETYALDSTRPATASIGGEVRKPGTYTLPRGSPLSALLLAAGGFTDSAFLRGAVLTRASARKAQESELREMAARVAAGAGSDRESGAVRTLVEFLKGLHPAGRVPVKLSLPRLLKGSPADIPLEEGDVLRIPARTGDVGVTGAVQAGSLTVPFEENTSWKGYVAKAGGYADGADRDHVYLLRTDGTTALLSPGFIRWNPAASRWEVTALTGAPPPIGAGDTIVIPRHSPPELPPKVARELPGILMRAAEITDAPVALP